MTNKQQKLALIHIAKKELKLHDEAYRAILGSVGLDSSKNLKTENQFFEIMKAFENLGFKKKKQANYFFKNKQKGGGHDRITKKQEYYIRGLWDLASRNKSEKSLNTFIQRISGIGNIAWLTVNDATKVILALRDIAKNAGYNPDYTHA